jgi:hypothetical protein
MDLQKGAKILRSALEYSEPHKNRSRARTLANVEAKLAHYGRNAKNTFTDEHIYKIGQKPRRKLEPPGALRGDGFAEEQLFIF